MIRNKKFLVVLMSLGTLAFSQCLVSASEAPVEQAQVAQTNAVADELANIKPQMDNIDKVVLLTKKAEGGISDEQRRIMWGYDDYLLGIHPTEGSDADKLVYLTILSERISKKLVSDGKFLSEFFGDVLLPDKLPVVASDRIRDVLNMDDRYRCGGEPVYDYSKGANGGNPRVIYILRGIADAVNAMFKNEAVRKELAAPVTAEDFDQLIKAKKLKLKSNIDSEESWVKRLEQERQTPEEAEKDALCMAKDNAKYFESELESPRLASLDGYKKSREEEKKALEKDKDKSWYKTAEGKKDYDERMGHLNKVLTDENELKADYDKEVNEKKGLLEKNRAVLTDKAKREEYIKEYKSKCGRSENLSKDILQNGKNFLAGLNVVTLESVNRAGASMNLGNFEGDFFQLFKSKNEGELSKYIGSTGYEVHLASKLNDIKSKGVFAEVRFRFDGLSRPSQLIAFEKLEDELYKSGCFSSSNVSVFNFSNIAEGKDVELEDGAVYKIPGWVGGSYNRFNKEFLSGSNDCFGFKIMAKNVETLEKFKASFPGVVNEILKKGFDDADLSERLGKDIMQKSYDYFGDIESCITKKQENIANKDNIGTCSCWMREFAGLFSPDLNNMLNVDVNDEGFKNAYVGNYEKIMNRVADIHLNNSEKFGMDRENSLSLNDKKALLAMLINRVDGLNESVIDNVPRDEHANKNFKKLVISDSCCFSHANLKLKSEDISGIKNIFSADPKNLSVSVDNVGDIGDSLTRGELNSFCRIDNDDLFKDIAYMWSLNRSKDEFERVKQDFSGWQQFFNVLSVRANVEKLTPEQRRKVMFACLLICVGVPDVVNYDFKNVPDIEIDSISYTSVQLAKYFGTLAWAIGEKISSLN